MGPHTFSFSTALEYLKKGGRVSRIGWNNPNILVKAQYPEENSKMTKPYLYMEKLSVADNGDVVVNRFPLDLSCESIFAEDWVEVNELKGEGTI